LRRPRPGLQAGPARLDLVPTAPAELNLLRRIVDDPRVGDTLFRGRRGDFFAEWRTADPRRAQATCHFTARLDGRVIGGAGLAADEMFYYLAPDLWGRGLGGAIARAALERALACSADALVLNIHRDNPASIRIAERLGFAFAGIDHRLSHRGRTVLRYVLRTGRSRGP
jgi:RimJ/RimL family protein N-acetyltransferase